MNEVTYLQPESIEDQPFPGYEEEASESRGRSNQTYLEQEQTPDRGFPTQTVANNVVSDSLDTQSKRILASYEFGEMGAIKIGTYVEGESGEINISPAGIVAKNLDGEITFTLDAVTGDATFKGTIAAGSLIAGSTGVGSSGNVFIDGENNRILISDGEHDRILIGYLQNGF